MHRIEPGEAQPQVAPRPTPGADVGLSQVDMRDNEAAKDEEEIDPEVTRTGHCLDQRRAGHQFRHRRADMPTLRLGSGGQSTAR